MTFTVNVFLLRSLIKNSNTKNRKQCRSEETVQGWAVNAHVVIRGCNNRLWGVHPQAQGASYNEDVPTTPQQLTETITIISRCPWVIVLPPRGRKWADWSLQRSNQGRANASQSSSDNIAAS